MLAGTHTQSMEAEPFYLAGALVVLRITHKLLCRRRSSHSEGPRAVQLNKQKEETVDEKTHSLSSRLSVFQ